MKKVRICLLVLIILCVTLMSPMISAMSFVNEENTGTSEADGNCNSEIQSPLINENETENCGDIDGQNVYNKLHFFESKIENFELLEVAVYRLKNSERNDDEIELTVMLKSDFKGQEEYQRLEKTEEEIKTDDDELEWRKQLVAFSREYHSSVFNENLGLFDSIKYTSIEHVEMTPFVSIVIPVSNVEADWIDELIRQENIVSASFNDKIKCINTKAI